MIHELKCWPEQFSALWDGSKNFELRKNDREFQVGDFLLIKEWIPSTEEYTGSSLLRKVSYVLRGPSWGLAEDHCIMSIDILNDRDIAEYEEFFYRRMEARP